MTGKGVPAEIANLRGKKRIFFEAWLANYWSVRAAAREVGLSDSRAYVLANDPAVVAAREAVRSQRVDAAIASADEVAEMLTSVVRSRLGNFLDENGDVDLEAVRAAGPEIAEVKIHEWPLKDGGVSRRITLKMTGRLAAAQQLARLRGYEAPTEVRLPQLNVYGLDPWEAGKGEDEAE